MALETSDLSEVHEAAAPYMEHVMKTWGDETDDMLEACALTVPHYTRRLHGSTMIRGADDFATLRPLIVVIERTLTGAIDATRTVYDVLGDVIGRENVAMLFTGGDTGRQHYDAYPAMVIFQNYLLANFQSPRPDNVSIDNVSMNTGTQALTVAHVADVGDFRTIYLVAPYDHVTRNCAVMIEAFRRRFSPQELARVSLIPVCYGHALSRNRSGLTMAHEAFGSNIPASDKRPEVAKAIRQRAGQFTERWKDSIVRRESRTWPCGAVTPGELVLHLVTQPFAIKTS